MWDLSNNGIVFIDETESGNTKVSYGKPYVTLVRICNRLTFS